MFPLVISTIPENGAKNVGLDSTIRINFSDAVDMSTVNVTNVKLKNNTTGEEINSITSGIDVVIVPQKRPKLDMDTTKSIVITPENKLDGLNTYKVEITGLKTPYGEAMFGTFEMKFTAKENSVTDVIVPPYIPPKEDPEDEPFMVTLTHPKEDNIHNSESINIRCNRILDVDTDKSGIILTESILGESIDEIELADVNLLDEDDIEIDGNKIKIRYAEFDHGKKYSLVISKVTSTTETIVGEIDDQTIETSVEIIEPYMFSFYSPFASYFGSVREIRMKGIMRPIFEDFSDYEIAFKIFENSELAEFISTEAETHDDIDWIGPALFVKRYVESKTQYDFIFNKIIDLSSSASEKTLEDLTIKYGHSLSDLLKFADKLKLDYLYWEDFLKGQKNRGNAKASPFLKGENADEMPEYKNRQLSDWEGTKGW